MLAVGTVTLDVPLEVLLEDPDVGGWIVVYDASSKREETTKDLFHLFHGIGLQ